MPFGVSRTPSTLLRSAVRVPRALQFIYQKVVRRKPVPFIPNEKNPEYILCYVKEELECGHTIVVHPHDGETLTARKRSCHECSGFIAGLKLPELKKKAQSVKETVKRKAQAGSMWWPIAFVAACALLAVYLIHPFARTYVLCSLAECASPRVSLRVIQKLRPKAYVLQEVVDGVPEAPEVRYFDIDPPFQPGFTIAKLKFEDRGDEWAVSQFNPYFWLLRDKAGVPITPANCPNVMTKPDYWEVLCEGEPRW